MLKVVKELQGNFQPLSPRRRKMKPIRNNWSSKFLSSACKCLSSLYSSSTIPRSVLCYRNSTYAISTTSTSASAFSCKSLESNIRSKSILTSQQSAAKSDRPNPHPIQPALAALDEEFFSGASNVRPLEPPYPHWYNPNAKCEFHYGEIGHSIEDCRARKETVQELVNNTSPSFKKKGPDVLY